MMFKKYILNHNAIQLSNKITLNMSENVLDLNRDLYISDLNRCDKCFVGMQKYGVLTLHGFCS